ncbi:MAG: GerMN domain-containing protein [Acidobacteriaceae bacterium]
MTTIPIPRHQRVLFWVMLAGSILMAIFLIRLRERAHDRLSMVNDPTPLAAPADQPAEAVTFEIANDADGTIHPVQQWIALPQNPTIRVRALLDRLLAQYALPQSTHPLSGGEAVDEVFLLPIPSSSVSSTQAPNNAPTPNNQYTGSGLLAVVDLHSSFVESHPSGIAVETLTLLSIARTLHENMPNIEQVRFLVDGQQRETLAGHADLTRVYLTADQPDLTANPPSINRASTVN